jgi:hypothetical protein
MSHRLSRSRSCARGSPAIPGSRRFRPSPGPMYQLFIFFMITDPKTTVRSRARAVHRRFFGCAAEFFCASTAASTRRSTLCSGWDRRLCSSKCGLIRAAPAMPCGKGAQPVGSGMVNSSSHDPASSLGKNQCHSLPASPSLRALAVEGLYACQPATIAPVLNIHSPRNLEPARQAQPRIRILLPRASSGPLHSPTSPRKPAFASNTTAAPSEKISSGNHGQRRLRHRLRQRRLAGHPLRQFHGLAGHKGRQILSRALSQQSRRHVYRRHPPGRTRRRNVRPRLRRGRLTTTTASTTSTSPPSAEAISSAISATASFADVTAKAGVADPGFPPAPSGSTTTTTASSISSSLITSIGPLQPINTASLDG